MTRPPTASFGQRLQDAVERHGRLCAGLDPHRALLEQWGLADDVAGLRQFTDIALEAFIGTVAAVKPQAAFFERHGSAGVEVLEQALARLREAGTLSVLDVKRGDIGSTMSAYAHAYLAQTSPLRADAITLSPYTGFESLRPAYELAAATGRGVFVLALTSNPEGAQLQQARVSPDGATVAGQIIEHAARRNAESSADWGSVGVVVGATTGASLRRLGLLPHLAASRAPVLAPGVGAQGIEPGDLPQVFGPAFERVLAAASRSLLVAGPSVGQLRTAARECARALGDR